MQEFADFGQSTDLPRYDIVMPAKKLDNLTRPVVLNSEKKILIQLPTWQNQSK